jgi:deazaflavin-dependent oxidoreductase (nitroreductase family)
MLAPMATTRCRATDEEANKTMKAPLAARLAAVANRSTLRLTHYGRKTGKPYEVTIWFLVDGDTVYLVTANVRRQWTRNVQVKRHVLLRVNGETFEGEVQRVNKGGEWKRVDELLVQKYWYVRPLLWVADLLGLSKNRGAFRVRLAAPGRKRT